MRTISAFILFLAGLMTANWLTVRSWNGTLYVYVGEVRAPASVRSVHDYSAIDRQALFRSVHEQLMSSAQLLRDEKNPEAIGVRLGHPLVQRGDGGKEFVCGVSEHTGLFDRVELTFYAMGVTENGEPTYLTANAPCRPSEQVDVLDAVWIPNVHGQENELNMGQTRVRFQNLTSHQPDSWALWSVRFYREDDPQLSLTVDAAQLKKAAPNRFTFSWPSSR